MELTQRGTGLSVSRRGPRSPGIVFGVIALGLILLVAFLTLTARQPPPPTIAEFAPQAVEQIQEAPTEQSSEFGSGGGEGECPPGAECGEGGSGGGGGGAPAPEIQTPRVRKCIGDPPRQIEDPQSPPCVPYWDGDNGGDTWRGVTSSQIRVVRPGGGDLGGEEVAMQGFFNKRFEFYGRKIELIPLAIAGGDASNTSGMQADAQKTDDVGAFASLAYDDRGGAEHYYYDELASRKIISVSGRATMSVESRYTARAPYQWNYLPPADVIFRNLGDFYCRSLKGRPPRYAGSGIDASVRKPGVIVEAAQDGTAPDPEPLRQALEGCGVSDTVYVEHTRGQSEGATTVLRLSEQEVTTVICLCHQGELAFNYMPKASGQLFFPEWLISTFLYHDSDLGGQTYPSDHQDHVFGLSFRNRMLGPPDDPRWWAVQEANPDIDSSTSPELNPYNAYKQLLVLASGIQLAGPNLNPETFEKGLFNARFPNPGAGDEPYFQATAGFGPGDHSMQDDGAIIWFNQEERSQEYHNSQGAWCYFEKGKRFKLGTWPKDEPNLFTGACR